jgi:hypothetical protein
MFTGKYKHIVFHLEYIDHPKLGPYIDIRLLIDGKLKDRER